MTMEGTGAAKHNLPYSEERLKGLIDLLSDWYWEQDSRYQFTLIVGEGLDRAGIDPSPYIGLTRWGTGAVPVGDNGCWDRHIAILETRQPFRDFIYRRVDSNDQMRYVSTSGQPVFDEHRQFTGYRGVAKDITQQYRVMLWRTIEHTVTRILSTSNRIVEIAPQIIQLICETLGWTCGAHWQVDESTNTIRGTHNWGIATPEIDEFLAFGKQMQQQQANQLGLIRRACASNDVVWLRDVTQEPTFIRADAAAKAGLHSAIAFPIKTDTQITSVLEFFNKGIQAPDKELIEGIAHISQQIGQFYQRIQAQERLHEAAERFQNLTELSSDWCWEQDQNFRFQYDTSSTKEYKPGLQMTSSIGKLRWELPFIDVTEQQWAEHRAMLAAHRPFYDLELKRLTANGLVRDISISGVPIFDESGEFKGYRGIGRDVTERKLAEARIKYLATHDVLTTLPNRSLFGEILNHAILSARRYSRTFAVLFIDLDRFKIINDTLGHEAGDMLLQEIGNRLTQTLRTSDVVARLGGDEFVVLLQEVDESEYVKLVANKILSSVIKPVVLLGQECRVTASIGISLFPNHAQDEQTLMKMADVAMYQAKEEGKNNYRFYSEEIKSQSLERLALETSLRQALERGQFFLHYQAKLDLKAGRITGVEALLRWRHPELGVIPPLQFIPLAEETGLIVPIGKWVLNAACEQNMAWQRAGFPPMCIAVNLSARQFTEVDLLDDIQAALQKSGLAPELLELELTESMVIQNPEQAIKLLVAIKDMGVRLAIDDFGTGYSSLAQLKRFPIDTLKVDRSFIRDIPHDHEDNAITEAIIAMAKVLSLTVVAEGVETREQEDFLRAHACDEIQGYYFSRPIDEDQFTALLREYIKPN